MEEAFVLAPIRVSLLVGDQQLRICFGYFHGVGVVVFESWSGVRRTKETQLRFAVARCEVGSQSLDAFGHVRHKLNMLLELWPACEPVFTRDHQLCIAQTDRTSVRVGMMLSEARNRFWSIGEERFQEILCLMLDLQ